MGYRPRDRESAVEFALELLATGRVRGVATDHQPAELERLIGPPVGEGIAGFSGNLVRDWGLLEAYYEREDEDTPWRAALLMGQMHRMPKPLKWRLIARELRTLGYEIEPEPQPTLEDHYFRVAQSGSEVVVNGGDAVRRWPRGHIAKISAPDWLALWPRPRTYEVNAVHRSIYRAVGTPERSWAELLAGQHPGTRAEWFRLAHGAAHTVVAEHPERAPEAAGLHDWLLGQAQAASVWPDTDQALLAARCASGTFGALPARPGAPSPDVIIGRCLAVLPLTRESAQLLSATWRELVPSDVQRSKLTRALLQGANRLRGQAGAQHVLAELAAWDDVLHKLV